MRVYVSGPITGITDYRERFAAATEALWSQRTDVEDVVNPCEVKACGDSQSVWQKHDLDVCQEIQPKQEQLASGHSWECYMRYDLVDMLARCDTLLMLPGWSDSRGAQLEYYVGVSLGYNILWMREDGEIR